MKRFLTVTMLCAGTVAFAQAPKKVYNAASMRVVNTPVSVPVFEPESTDPLASANKTLPVGSISTSALTTIKIGDASNAYTFISNGDNQISTANVGNGVVAFIYRQNAAPCGGTLPADNGRLRYALSSDGGANWNVGIDAGQFTVVNAANPPAAGSCMGLFGPGNTGGINPNFTATQKPARYPNAVISTNGGTSLADVRMVYAAPRLQNTSGGSWDGHIRGTVTGAATLNPTVTQELYMSMDTTRNIFPKGIIERKPGEFWFVGEGWDPLVAQANQISKEVVAFKGTLNATTNSVFWVEAARFSVPPNPSALIPTASGSIPAYIADPSIGFEAGNNQQKGWIGFIGDIESANDANRVLNPHLIQTTDGGATWGPVTEIDINQFPDLFNKMAFQLDSAGTTKVIDRFQADFSGTDMVVDVNGNPHLFFIAAGHAYRFAQQQYANDSYGFYFVNRTLFDLTKDSYGDWSLIRIDSIRSYDGELGKAGQTSGSNNWITYVNSVQASTSPDGSRVFVHWTDTDTRKAGWQATPSFDPNGGTFDNNAPELWGRGINVTNFTVTDSINWSGDDAAWAGKMYWMKTSSKTLSSAGVHKVPAVFTALSDNTEITNPASFFYVSNIQYTDAQFTKAADFLYNCKAANVTKAINVTPASCGQNDGKATLTINSNNGGFAFQWTDAAGSVVSALDSAIGLTAGIYNVIAADAKGCGIDTTVVITNANAPSLTISNVADVLCAGGSTGSATANANGGTGSLSYAWSSGATTATANNLPKGTSTVTVTDGAGCKSFATVTINEPAAISIAADTVVNIKCNGGQNGSLSVKAQGGTGTLSYSWTGGATGTKITNLAAGSYTLTVKDANNCSFTKNYVVAQPAKTAVTATSNQANRLAGPTFNGTAQATGAGGTSPYTYAWTVDTVCKVNGQLNPYHNGNSKFLPWSTGTAKTQAFQSGLCGGFYIVEMTDANGCKAKDTAEVKTSGAGIKCTTNCTNAIDVASGIQSFEMYPNPAKNSFTLSLALQTADDLNISLIGMDGKVLMTRDVRHTATFNEAISVQGLARGIYFVRVNTSTGSAVDKIIVE